MTENPSAKFLAAFAESAGSGSFVKLTLSHYTGAEDALKQIHIRKLIVKRQERLGFTYRYQTRDIAKNYTADEAVKLVENYLYRGFRKAFLCTTDMDFSLDISATGIATLTKQAAQHAQPPSLDHDRKKQRPIAVAQPYLHALNITDANGKVYANAQDKFRQINKYVEIVSGLIAQLPAHSPLRIADMGSGKGYLTFALYDHITNTLNRPAEITGVEYRADMVALCNRVAGESGFTGLRFVEGSIADYDSTGIHVLIALHACDTATDDAIAKAIRAGAELIVVAPCCHKQIRREMEKHPVTNDLAFLTKHGTFLERQAEMVTDGMRALILEHFGYSTKLFEFISDAHTPKNVMIVATRKRTAPNAKSLDTIRRTKAYFGIGHHHLERLMELEP